MKVIRAEHLGMCFGVRDAIALALDRAKTEPLTILGELVHNEIVLSRLRSQGIRIETDARQVATRTAMVSAHGASERAISQASERGLTVIEATCPLVRLAHRSAVKLAREGCYPVVIGKRGHVEVRGLTEDFDACSILLSDAELEAIPEKPKYGVVAQTTQPIDKVRHWVARLQDRFPHAEVRFIDTVCLPTKQRQASAVEMSQQVDAVIVVGGNASNNTRELAATCRQYCPKVHQIQTAADLRPEWFSDIRTAGLTAGTSTPDSVIDEVERQLLEWETAHAPFLLS
jgi:4-hydroxy-3-methylbut-2-enyl diphosphate reductase